jgi:Ctr copper transporter family
MMMIVVVVCWGCSSCVIVVEPFALAIQWPQPPPLDHHHHHHHHHKNTHVVVGHERSAILVAEEKADDFEVVVTTTSSVADDEEKDDFESMDHQPEEHVDHDSPSHSAAAAAAAAAAAIAAASNSKNTSFCQNDGGMMSMAMYMDGWHWSTTGGGTTLVSLLDCLNYLVPSWRLETQWKFHGALLYTFCLAVLLSAVSSVRVGTIVAMMSSVTKNDTGPPPPCNNGGVNHHSSSSCALWLLFLYAIQALLGYALMLVVMTYSIELLLAVIAGLVTGHVVWAAARPEQHDTEFLCSNDNEDDDDDDLLSQDGVVVHVEQRQSLRGPADDFDGNVEGTLGTSGTLLYRRR